MQVSRLLQASKSKVGCMNGLLWESGTLKTPLLSLCCWIFYYIGFFHLFLSFFYSEMNIVTFFQLLWKPKFSLCGQTFLYKLHNLCIFMDFYLVLLREVCPKFSQPHGHSVKGPYPMHNRCRYMAATLPLY
jgi:hypothetical protein